MRFLHIRTYDLETPQGDVIRTKGGKTVAYEVDGLNITFATACCSERDNYCRKTGRTIAEGRFNAGKANVIAMNPEENPIELILDRLVGV